MRPTRCLAALFACSTLIIASAEAQTVSLPDQSATTTLTAIVSEQATISVPTDVTFNVTNVGASTAATAASVTVSNIVLANATKRLKVSLQAAAASFTPPVAGAATWAPADVTWNAATWTNATGASGTLSSGAFNEVATCTADAASCNTTALTFTLGANTAVKRSGNHTLVVRWKVEVI
jgi:hypothetical protein